MIKKCWQLLLITLLSGCAVFGINQMTELDKLYGKAQVQYRVAAGETEQNTYLNKVKPVLDNRCVVCHACYDAACQLKLSSPAGIDRGASKELVYDASVFTREPSRLFIDAENTEAWRKSDFFPVLNERGQIAEANQKASVLHKMLTLKKQNPLPAENNQILPEGHFNFELNYARQCPTIETFPAFARDFSSSGMPYGLPALNDNESAVINEWLLKGARMTDKKQPESHQNDIERWETFLNGNSLKQQLASRYIFEHLFLAHIHFDQREDDIYYKIVRSSTPPGEPIVHIKTRLPFQDPGISRVYYRLWFDPATVVTKNHLPYVFNPERMAWLKKLFIDEPYEVTHMPNYMNDIASNPFVAFDAIPVRSRYRFMLEEARYTIMGFIKGPVCRGQVALNAIQDHFWVVFVNPENQNTPMLDSFLMQQSHNLKLPGSEGGYASLLGSWSAYSEKNTAYLKAKMQQMQDQRPDGQALTLDHIWHGDGHNKNAALTVFRHFDSATVVHGLIGQPPKTSWLVNYPLLERIHYLLVAEFDVFGNLGHQLSTRLYMDFLRQEGEISFLTLLPKEERSKTQMFWYRETNDALSQHLKRCESLFEITTGLDLRTDEPQVELYQLLQAHLSPVLEKKYDIFNRNVPREHRRLLKNLEDLHGYFLNYFPEVALLTIEEPDGQTYIYTVLRNLAHSNINSLFSEQGTRLINEDYLTVVRGVVGDYPAAFWHVKSKDLDDFVTGIGNITSEADYANIMTHFGIRRSHHNFCQHSDKVHKLFTTIEPVDSGLLDYNRLENR
ncbi:MAG: fatty acid cis/trans isomerase [Gammaproteobacteria bacterium]|nr:fatty acid cis/trans isomerase [Gammaproteobacteria bacterium]